MPVITLPDGSNRHFDQPLRGDELAASIGRKLEKDAVAIRLNGRLVDLGTLITDDAEVAIITPGFRRGDGNSPP